MERSKQVHDTPYKRKIGKTLQVRQEFRRQKPHSSDMCSGGVTRRILVVAAEVTRPTLTHDLRCGPKIRLLRSATGYFEVRAWSFSGAWSLEFGAFLRPASPIPIARVRPE